jgi:hypothetical protein
MKLLPIFLLFVLVCSFAGCLGATAGIVVVQDKCESSFSLDKGIVYDVDIWVKNEGSVSKSAEVTAELIASSTGKVRDRSTQIVNLKPDESKQLKFVLDGENGIDYQYSYHVKNL